MAGVSTALNEMTSVGWSNLVLIVVMLAAGSVNTINTKFQLQTCAPVSNEYQDLTECPEGGEKKYDKTWLNVLFMFIGETSMFAVYLISEWQKRRAEEAKAAKAHALEEEDQQIKVSFDLEDSADSTQEAKAEVPFYTFAIPAFCDVVAMGLSYAGMKYMSAAIWQMLRSSIIIFSAVLTVFFLGKRLALKKWLAVFIVTIGVVMVGCASLLDTEEGDDTSVFGVLMVVGAQGVGALMMVWQEKLVTGKKAVPTTKLLALEGMWGVIFTSTILLVMSLIPGDDAGHFESAPQGLAMIARSWTMVGLVVTFTLSVGIFNFTSITIAAKMSTVIRSLLDSARTIIVWAVELIVFYGIDEGYGTPWKPHSWLAVLAFVVIVLGTLMYKEVLPLPHFLDFLDAYDQQLESEETVCDDEKHVVVPAQHRGVQDPAPETALTIQEKSLSSFLERNVRAEGLEAQLLRRCLVKGSTIVFICAGYSGKRFVFERCHALGIKTVVLENEGSWAESLLKEGIISKFIHVDMSGTTDQIVDECLEVLSTLGDDGITGKAEGIVTLVDMSGPIVAKLCQELGLPGHDPAAIAMARDKHATRDCLRRAKLPTPRTFLINSKNDLDIAAEVVKFPAIMKPVSGAASQGVMKVGCVEEMEEVWTEIVTELRETVSVGGVPFGRSTSNVSGIKSAQVVATSVLMEQWLDGDEVDIDIVLSDGESKYCALTDNGPTVQPWFNESWGVCPSMVLTERKQEELMDLSIKILQAMNFKNGVFHVECKYTSTGPQLIEVNPRMGGGPVHEINRAVWGVDLVEECIFASLGIPARPVIAKAPLACVAYNCTNAEFSGIVDEVPDLSKIAAREDVIWAKVCVERGEQITGPEDGMPTHTVIFMAKGDTPKEAFEKVKKFEAENPVTVEEGSLRCYKRSVTASLGSV